MEIGLKLKQARINSGITQENIARQLGVSRQTVSNWERGVFYPDIVSIIRLSEIYDISLDNLLKGDANIMHQLEKSTDTVKSVKKLILLGAADLAFMIVLMMMGGVLAKNPFFIAAACCIAVAGVSALFIGIIKMI